MLCIDVSATKNCKFIVIAKLSNYHEKNDIVEHQDEALVRHPDNFGYQGSGQQGLRLTDTEI